MIDEIRELPARFPQPRSAVMPALDLAQEELGYLTPDGDEPRSPRRSTSTRATSKGVATFYSLFHHAADRQAPLLHVHEPRAACCAAPTSSSITCKKAIGVSEPGEVSKDGLFSYEEVECLGACEYAPMCRLDHRYHYDLTAGEDRPDRRATAGCQRPYQTNSHRAPAPEAEAQAVASRARRGRRRPMAELRGSARRGPAMC